MGKSSLIHMLPVQLGTGTVVAAVDFQRLSGSPQRAHAHRWIAEEVAGACPEAPRPPEAGDAWGETLAWLGDVDAALAADGRRLLVAVDEVERLEDGIRAGWAAPDLLDFLRAAGDALHRVRFLLASAYRPRGLGAHWSDRLISLRIRELRRLGRGDAEDLVRRPVRDFPDIYPEDGVERILRLTAGHPYLTQLVCDRLCRHLNAEGRLVATDEDVERAIDDAFLETTLFGELWDKRTEAERRVLEALAAGDDPPTADRPAVRDLEREDYVEQRDGRPVVAVPMFADWIADRG